MAVEDIWLGLERVDQAHHVFRHCHDRAYAALVVSGGYHEAGDSGRRRVGAGDVLIHGRFEGHQNSFDSKGAVILNLPCAPDMLGCSGWIEDPDRIVRTAERDPWMAMAMVLEALQPGMAPAKDWPDLLAAALDRDEVSSLFEWAEAIGVARGSLSRGFALAYGVSPQRFRADRRACRAVHALTAGTESLTRLAAELGYADQAHMSREVSRLTGAPPSRWRTQGEMRSRQGPD